MWSILLSAVLAAEPEVLHVPNDAVIAALADAAASTEERRPCLRYVWIPDGSKDTAAAVSFAVNTAISKASVPIRVRTVGAGRLAQLDLAALLPEDADLKRALELWEKQAGQDPYFYVRLQQKTTAYRADDGKTYDWKWAVSFGGWVNLAAAVQLQALTKSAAPIQRADRFVIKTLTVLDGGLYYDWAGIRKSDKAGQTDFEKFLDDHGVDVKKAEKLRAERRSALLQSGVTAKPRAIEEVQGLLGTATWTEDRADNNRDPKAHAILTLLDPKFDASEAIALKANGFCDFALFDGQGKLQDVVPDNIAKDHTIPAPYTARLQPALSCIRCHAQGGGFRTARNDIAELRKHDPEEDGGITFDVVDDERGRNARDALDRIAGLYRGNLERLDRGRDDYADAVFLATGGQSVAAISATVQAIDDGYQRTPVSPVIACRELGIGADEKSAVSVLRKLLPPIQREDGRIGFLRKGLSIVREDFEDIYPDAALRSRPAYEAMAKGKE